MANSVDPDQTVPIGAVCSGSIGAVCSGSTLFASILNLSVMLEGAQWLSGRVLDLRQRSAGSSLTGVTAMCPYARTLILA